MTISLVCLLGAPSAFACFSCSAEEGYEPADREMRGDHDEFEARGKRRGRGMRGNRHEKMKRIRSKILRKRVGLDQATLERVEAIFEPFDEQRKALHQAKRQTMKALRDLVKSDSEEQDAYATLLAAARQAHEGLRQLREEEMAQLAQVLTPRQQARLMMALHKLKRRMQGMRGNRGGPRGPRDGSRGPRQRRGFDGEGGGYGPPPGRGFGGQGQRGAGGHQFDDDLIDL
jgi:Spy/CpxP family protein refolding chaperone